jgi:hypothetical protein
MAKVGNNKRKVSKSSTKTRHKSILHANDVRREVISIHQFSKIAMSFWIGGSLMVAIVIFPLLFKVLDVVSASSLVGSILNMLAYIGIVSLFVALIEVVINHKLALVQTKRFWYILAMGFLLIVNYFAIFPMVSKLKQQLSMVAHQIISVQSNMFDFWHSLSAVTFVVICIIGFLYLIEM